jgi:hypothetical protein
MEGGSNPDAALRCQRELSKSGYNGSGRCGGSLGWEVGQARAAGVSDLPAEKRLLSKARSVDMAEKSHTWRIERAPASDACIRESALTSAKPDS